MYLLSGSSQTPLSVAGLQDFVYIAGRNGAVGALSMSGGLYTYDVNSDSWTSLYSSYGSNFAHLARFDGGYVFYRTQGTGSNAKHYIVVVKDDQTAKAFNVPGPVYSISTGPYNYCVAGMYYQGGARIYTFLVTSLPDSLTYYTPGMFTPEAVIQGFHSSPRSVVYSTTNNYTYVSANPTGTRWTAATTRPQLTGLTKGLYVNEAGTNTFMLIGGNMKSVSTDRGNNWTTSTLGTYLLTDLIYVDSNWYAIGMNGTKRFLLQNTASTFDQSNKILDLPDYSRQVIKINT